MNLPGVGSGEKSLREKFRLQFDCDSPVQSTSNFSRFLLFPLTQTALVFSPIISMQCGHLALSHIKSLLPRQIAACHQPHDWPRYQPVRHQPQLRPHSTARHQEEACYGLRLLPIPPLLPTGPARSLPLRLLVGQTNILPLWLFSGQTNVLTIRLSRTLPCSARSWDLPALPHEGQWDLLHRV